MGTWGSKNFDSDEASEYLDTIIRQLLTTIATCLNSETHNVLDCGEAELMPSVDLLILICSHYDVSPLVTRDTIRKWRDQYLNIFDYLIDGYSPKPEFKAKRREIIQDTFAKLEKLGDEPDQH